MRVSVLACAAVVFINTIIVSILEMDKMRIAAVWTRSSS